jgi:predicted DNA-binding protein (UPF0278 family)
MQLMEVPRMAEVKIAEKVWQAFVKAARARGKRPELLAEKALKNYAQQMDDEQLLEASCRAARKARFRIEDTEEIIRQYRRERAKRMKNGGT